MNDFIGFVTTCGAGEFITFDEFPCNLANIGASRLSKGISTRRMDSNM
jgi:hypothetical protein